MGHEGEGEGGAEFAAEGFEDLDGVGDVAGEDEMADEEAGLGGFGARGVEGVEIAFFGGDAGEGGEGDVGIAGVAHDFGGEGGGRKFEVGEENLHEGEGAVEEGGGVVAGGVEDEGDGDAAAAEGAGEGFDVGPDVVGGDEVEIVRVFGEEGEGHLEKAVGGDGVAESAGARDLLVLAEEAVAGAAREEEGAGTAGAGDGGLFAEVAAVGGDAEGGGFAATAGGDGAVDGAGSGAEGAGHCRGRGFVVHVWQGGERGE